MTDRHRNNFDLIRLVIALQVVLLHSMAYAGVSDAPIYKIIRAVPPLAVFFFISGYLLSDSLDRDPSLLAYARRRILRVYPIIWAIFALTLVVIGVQGFITPEFRAADFWPWVVAQLTVGQFYNPEALRDYGVGVANGQLWTVPVEVGFYILLPLLLVVWRRAGSLALVLIACLSLWVGQWSGSRETVVQKLVHVSVVPHLWQFLLGVLAHRHRDRVITLVRGRFAIWFAVFAVVASLAPPWSAPVVVALALLIPAAAFTAEGLASRLLNGNDISFGLYGFHMLVLNVLLEQDIRGWTAVGATLAITIGLACLSWRYVESPALALKSKRRRTPVVALADVRRLPDPRFARSGSERPAPVE